MLGEHMMTQRGGWKKRHGLSQPWWTSSSPTVKSRRLQPEDSAFFGREGRNGAHENDIPRKGKRRFYESMSVVLFSLFPSRCCAPPSPPLRHGG